MRSFWLALSIIFIGTLAVEAQNLDTIKERQKIYKSFGEATKPISAILKGDAPYDQAAVQKALTAYAEGSKKLPGLFGDDTKTGGDTEALPAIWEHKADFETKLKTFGADSTAAMSSIKDKATFAANFPAIAKQCGACHKLYREKKDK